MHVKNRTAGLATLAPAYGICAALLVWPLFYNGFPLVFSDTGEYISAAIMRSVPSDRPIYYGIFAYFAAHLPSLYAVPPVQGLILTAVLNVAAAVMLGALNGPCLAAVAGALAALTPLPWFVSWLMPDVFAGIMVVGFITLTVYWRRVTTAVRLFLLATIVFSGVMATGNLLVLLLMTAGALTGELVILHRLDRVKALCVAGTVVFSYGLAVAPNYAYYHRLTINPDASVFMVARLIDTGSMVPYLEQTCPRQPEIPLCPLLDEVRKVNGEEFLWGDDSLSERTGARRENGSDYANLAKEALGQELFSFVVSGGKAALQLLAATSLGETYGEDVLRAYIGEGDNPPYKLISGNYQKFIDDYSRARQQTGTLDVGRFNPFYRCVTYASYILLAALVWWWSRCRMHELAAAGGLVFLALAVNAAVFGILSGPYPRYEARITWVAAFFVVVGSVTLTRSARAARAKRRRA